jgi:hypothetical protein
MAPNDDRLSYKALGIHTYLMSKPDGWEANESDIATRHTDGRSAVRSGIQELIDYGYMVRIQIRKDKKVVGWRLDTYETPELNPHFDANKPPKVITVDLDNEQPLDLECENLNVANRTVADLECDFLQVENLQVENRIHSNYINTVTKEEQKIEHVPPSLPPTPTKPEASTGDLLMDAAKARFTNRTNGKIGSWQAELNLDLAANRRVPLANRLAEIWKMKSAIDAGNDRANRTCHEVAVRLFKLGVKDAEALNVHYNAYLADDWRKKNNPNPKPEKLEEFISQSQPSEKDTTQRTASWQGFNNDLPDYMREMMQ